MVHSPKLPSRSCDPTLREGDEGYSDAPHRKHDGANPDPKACICVYRWHRRMAEGIETMPND